VSLTYAPPPGDPTEVLGRRFAAFAIDVVILGIVGVILFATATHHSYYGAPPNSCAHLANRGSSICFQTGGHLYVWDRGTYTRAFLLAVLAGFLDLVVLQTLMGASIGKLCVGLRVIEASGHEARFLRMVGRWLFLIVDAGCFLVGLVTTLATHPHRRVGDLVCGTYVVATSSVGQPIVAAYAMPGYGAPPPGYVPGAYPAGWGGPPPTSVLPPVVPTPPGTAPTTPGEWGAVARPSPLQRSPQWQAPPSPQPTGTEARAAMAPQWAAPPGPKGSEPEPATEQEAGAAEPGDNGAGDEPLAREVVTQWSPIVPLTNNASGPALAAPTRTEPPAAAPARPWNPIVPAAPVETPGPPSPSPSPAPPPPAEPP